MSEPERKPRARRFRLPISRARAIELAVVIFGVLVAVGLDNLAEEIRLHGDARDLEKALQADIESAVRLSWERQLLAPCMRQRLALLAERASTPGAAATPTLDHTVGNLEYAVSPSYRAPLRVWTSYTFDRALGSEAFKRIPRDRADEYVQTFAQIASQREANDAEFYATANLAPLAVPQPDMDPEVRADLLKSIALLDRYNAVLVLVGGQIIETALALPGGEDIRTALRDRAQFAAMEDGHRQTYGSCIDLGATARLLDAVKG